MYPLYSVLSESGFFYAKKQRNPSVRGCRLVDKVTRSAQRQLWLFPNAAHDDLTDTFASGIQYFEHLIAEGYNARQRAAQEEGKWVYVPRIDSNGVQIEG